MDTPFSIYALRLNINLFIYVEIDWVLDRVNIHDNNDYYIMMMMTIMMIIYVDATVRMMFEHVLMVKL